MKLSYVILYVTDIERSITFYQKAFGLIHRFTHESGDYAEMDTGATTLAFAAHGLAGDILKQDYQKAEDHVLGTQITLEPTDVKAAYVQALDHGAIKLTEPEVKPWNFEVAIVRDLDGHIVELAKDLS